MLKPSGYHACEDLPNGVVKKKCLGMTLESLIFHTVLYGRAYELDGFLVLALHLRIGLVLALHLRIGFVIRAGC